MSFSAVGLRKRLAEMSQWQPNVIRIAHSPGSMRCVVLCLGRVMDLCLLRLARQHVDGRLFLVTCPNFVTRYSAN